MYLKQYMFCFYEQHIHLFSSITPNWSIEGNVTLYQVQFGL